MLPPLDQRHIETQLPLIKLWEAPIQLLVLLLRWSKNRPCIIKSLGFESSLRSVKEANSSSACESYPDIYVCIFFSIPITVASFSSSKGSGDDDKGGL